LQEVDSVDRCGEMNIGENEGEVVVMFLVVEVMALAVAVYHKWLLLI
jgi:hypothetical protein